MGRSAAQQSAETFLEHLQHDAQFLSYEEIGSISDTLAKATSILRQAHNEQCPLFKLPVEILHRILEFVPDPCSKRWMDFMPFWHNTLMDSSMLIPVAHTCRYLREVAVAHPRLWTTFHASFENLRLPLIRQMAEWSKHIPLNAVGPNIGILKELPPGTRFGSIHLYEIGADGFRCLQTCLEQLSSAALRSFSLFMNETDDWYPENDTLPLTPECAPNLRELTIEDAHALADRGFPSLTHLTLIDVSVHNFHTRFISFIRECPRLESIVLSGFAIKLEEGTPNTPPSIPLQHLKHVTLHSFFARVLNYYVPLLRPRVHGSSIQVLSYHAEDPTFPPSFLLPLPPPPDEPLPSPSAQNRICIGVHPTRAAEHNYAISLTTISARSTRRLTAWNDELATHGTRPREWPSLVLSQHIPSPLAADEVWLYGIDATTFRARPPLAHFFGATRVVVALDRRLHYDEPPSLRPLPSTSAHDPAYGSQDQAISITSLRIVYGFSAAHGESTSFAGPSESVANARRSKFELPLGQLVRDLRSGGYGYLKHFVLQVTPHMRVDETELAEVKEAGRFDTFAFERIEEFPEMPGHSDPARWGCKRYPGSLW